MLPGPLNPKFLIVIVELPLSKYGYSLVRVGVNEEDPPTISGGLKLPLKNEVYI